MSVGKVCGYVQISVAPCADTGGATAAHNAGFFWRWWYFMNDSVWCVVWRASQVGVRYFFCSRSLRLSGRRKVISESIFSVRSLNLIRLQCREAASHHSLAWTQWCERSVLPTSRLHTSICSDAGFTLSQRIRWSDGFSSATGYNTFTVAMMNDLCYCEILSFSAI